MLFGLPESKDKYVIFESDELLTGAVPVRLSLFYDHDVQTAKSATHGLIDMGDPEILYMGDHAQTKAALVPMQDFGEVALISVRYVKKCDLPRG